MVDGDTLKKLGDLVLRLREAGALNVSVSPEGALSASFEPLPMPDQAAQGPYGELDDEDVLFHSAKSY